MVKKGVFFSIDALISLILILSFVSMASYFYLNKQTAMQPSYYASDIVQILSTVKLNEINKTDVLVFLSNNNIEDTNKTILEQALRLKVGGNDYAAEELLNLTLGNLAPDYYNFGVWFEGYDDPIYKTSQEPSKQLMSSKQMISGIEKGRAIEGLSSRIFLANINQMSRSVFTYFGGYEGDGNITKLIFLPNNTASVNSCYMELDTGSNITFYINGIFSGVYNKTSFNQSADKWNISQQYLQNFKNGTNTVGLIFNMANQSYVGGGYIKLDYLSSEINLYNDEGHITHYLPGIDGIINLYDSFYVPGSLSNMSIRLHYNSSYGLFLTIGNTIVFNSSLTGERTDILNNINLSSILNYSYLSNKTVPFRFGLQNSTLAGNFSGDADVILITDVSGSMDWKLNQDYSIGNDINCSDSQINATSTKRISLAKCIDKEFVATILSGKGNRVGLISFEYDADNYVNLTSNQTIINNSINLYAAGGGTCIACAINRAYTMLQTKSNSSRKKYIIMMTDGVPNQRNTPTCYDSTSIASKASLVIQAGDRGFISTYNLLWGVVNLNVSTNLYGTDIYNSTFAFAVGGSGKIYRLNGTTWSEQQDLGSMILTDVKIFNATLAFATADDNKIYKWSGGNWAVNYTGSNPIRSIAKLNSTFAFAVGGSGKIYKLNKTIWSEYQDLGSANLYGVDIYNSTFAFAVGGSGKIYRLNGTTWSEQQDLGSMILTDVKIFNATLAFATADDNKIYKWSGGNWAVNYTGSYEVKAITKINSTLAFAVGDSRGGFVRWEGYNWTNFFPPYLYSENSTASIECNDDYSCSLTKNIPMLNANYSSCRVKDELNATVHSVGFGPLATCNFGVQTLQNIASCGNGSFYASSNASALRDFYQGIADSILTLQYVKQISAVLGNVSTKLYTDSYIELYYNSDLPQNVYGRMPITVETPRFNNEITQGSFDIPSKVVVYDAKLISYSGEKWTDRAKISNNNYNYTFYNLSLFGSQYYLLGDPYIVNIPVNYIVSGNNSIFIGTGLGPTNSTKGSKDDKAIYTVGIDLNMNYTGVFERAEGCRWIVNFEDNTSSVVLIPSSYNGSSYCNFNSTTNCNLDYDDALNNAFCNLLDQLDFDNDGLSFIKFGSNDLSVDTLSIGKIPYMWGPNIAEVRVWR